MNSSEFSKWLKLSPSEQLKTWADVSAKQKVIAFKKARLALGLNQAELAEKLKAYTDTGSVSAVQKWERGASRIPVLIYELIKCDFNARINPYEIVEKQMEIVEDTYN